jgi:hypothetical protein
MKPKPVSPFNRPMRSLVGIFRTFLPTAAGSILLVTAIAAAIFAPEFVSDARTSERLVARVR